jgi:mono/diheme cytochrome c family protein
MNDRTGLSKLKTIYAITSLLFLVVLAVSPLKDVFREWRKYQKEYNKLVGQQPVRIKPVPIALKQLWIKDLDRVDRCVTCHLGLREKNLVDAPQPFRTHPKIDHDIESFGCTSCHLGQGRSTDYADAHLPTPFWDEPVLPKRYLESSCGTCHQERETPEAPVLNRGRELITEYSCVSCHKIEGFDKAFTPGLDGIGSKVNRSWLVRWLKDPKQFRPETKMPDFLLSDEQVNVLADLLMSFKEFPGNARLDSLPEVYRERADDGDFIALGKTRFREARCISCHAVGGRGGKLAPDLVKVASKASPVWIYNFLKNPKRLLPGVEMPQFGFSEEELAAVTAYITSEFIDWDAPEDTLAAYQPAPDFYERGMRIFNEYNCGGCHKLNDPKVSENLGPDLTAVGSRKLYELDFGNADIPRTLYDFVYNKLKTPRLFRETLRMPQYAFTEEELQAITTALLAQRDEDIPPKYVVEPDPEPRFEPQGRVGEIFRKYSCLACHKVNGRGGEIAPDLTRVGSQLQRDWVEKYFEVPYSLRPIQAERMPNLFIAKDEVKVLADYFYTVLLDDSLQVEGIPLGDPEGIENGRILFWEKYGCQSCHQIGAKGGYVGPPLDRSGTRLQPGWIVRWLMDPQKYKPGTLEPRSGMTEEEAKAVAAYLMSLREE